MSFVRSFGIILAAGVLAGSAAFAQVQQQGGVSALKGHNSNAPVDVTADRIEVQDRADRALFIGNVHATQAELTLETARGDFGIYDLDRKLITVIGNVQLNQRQNVVSGQRLVINLDTGRAVIDGGPPGVNSSGGRVKGHFTVPQRNGS